MLDHQANQLRSDNEQLSNLSEKLRSQIYDLKQELRWHVNNGCKIMSNNNGSGSPRTGISSSSSSSSSSCVAISPDSTTTSTTTTSATTEPQQQQQQSYYIAPSTTTTTTEVTALNEDFSVLKEPSTTNTAPPWVKQEPIDC